MVLSRATRGGVTILEQAADILEARELPRTVSKAALRSRRRGKYLYSARGIICEASRMGEWRRSPSGIDLYYYHIQSPFDDLGPGLPNPLKKTIGLGYMVFLQVHLVNLVAQQKVIDTGARKADIVAICRVERLVSDLVLAKILRATARYQKAFYFDKEDHDAAIRIGVYG